MGQTARRGGDTGPTELEVGYTIGRPFWGKGYATEAAAAARDFALERLGARRLVALIIRGNDASANVARKLGFEYERNVKFGRRDAQLSRSSDEARDRAPAAADPGRAGTSTATSRSTTPR